MLTRDQESISWYFLQESLPKGGGTNVVNVILVDFRGYDTMGEITVLGIAAIGVLALMDGMRTRRPGADAQGRQWTFAQQPLLLRVAQLVAVEHVRHARHQDGPGVARVTDEAHVREPERRHGHAVGGQGGVQREGHARECRRDAPLGRNAIG